MKKYISIFAAILVLASCQKDFEEVKDTSSLTGSAAIGMVESDPDFLSSYVSGFYSYAVEYGGNHDNFGILSIGYCTDMMTTDIAVGGSWNWGTYDINHDYGEYDYRRPAQIWTIYYTLISKANEVIDFFGEEDPSNETLKGYLGQAYALRVFAYTNLLAHFQDLVEGSMESTKLRSEAPAVPLVFASRDGISTEEADALSGRNTVSVVMSYIEKDIAKSQELLANYRRATKNEINLQVAQGFAARYYLLTQQWKKAAESASAAINGFDLMDSNRLFAGFMEIEDSEVMWGFNHSTETQTSYASFFSHLSNDCSGYGGIGQSVHCIDRKLYDQIPATDYRKGLFNGPEGDPKAPQVGGQMPYAARKFGYMASWLQDYIYMRAAEMYLIAAEGYLRDGNVSSAQSAYSTLVSKRDPGYNGAAPTLADIVLQRRIELWGEGFSYIDYRRLGMDVDRKYEGTNHAAGAMYNFKAHQSSWNFQIPNQEMQNNPKITEAEQNPWETGAK